MAIKIQLRRGTASQWTSTNPILALGEVGYESDTGKFKIGSGSTTWTDLLYATNTPAEVTSAITAAINAIDTDDIEEGSTNKYFTDERAQDAVGNSLGQGLSYNDGTGAVSVKLDATGAGLSTSANGLKVALGNGLELVADAVTINASSDFTIQSGELAVESTGTIASKTYVDTAESDANNYTDTVLYNHNADTTSVHGIADTSLLETTSGAQSKADSAQSAANSYTDTAIANLIDSSPTALNTLNELAAALGDDPNFATTITTSIGTKATLEVNTSSTWTSTNPILGANVFGLESNTGKFKIGNGVTAWTTLPYAGTTSAEINTLTSDITTAYETYTDDAIVAHNVSTNVHGISDSANLAYFSDVSNAISQHSNVTTNVHGISDTADLAYLDGPIFTGNVVLPNTTTIGDVSYSEISILYGATITPSELDILNGVTASTSEINKLDGLLSTTAELNILNGATLSTAELNVLDGITSSTAELNILDGVTASAAEINKLDGLTASTTELNLISGLTASSAELNVLDGITASTNELNILDGVTATASEINVLSGATLSTAELNLLDGVTATTTELNYVDGVTSSIQTQLDAKAPTSSPTFTGTVSGITKSMVGLGNVDNTTDADKPVSTATQTALDLKADLAGPTFTGTVVLPSTTSIGNVSATEIGYVDGVTSSIQTQLNGKAALSGATFTGSVEIPGLTITGNLVVQGTTTTVSAADLKIRDNMVYLNQAGLSTVTNAVGNGTSVTYTTDAAHGYEAGDYVTISGITPSSFNISGDGLEITAVTSTTFTVTSTVTDTYTSGGSARGKVHFNPDLGWSAGRYDTVNGSGYAHAGMFRDASDGVFKIFDGYTPEPDDSVFINTSHSSFGLAPVAVASITATSATIGNVSNTELQYLDGVTSAIQAQLNSKAPTANPTFTGTVTVAASGIAFTDGTQTKVGVPSITTISQKTSSYTLSDLAERDTIIEVDSTSGTTITIPLDSTINYPVGTTLDIIQTNTGQVTIAGAGGVTVNATPGLKLRARWSSATLLKRASNTWLVYGDLTA